MVSEMLPGREFAYQSVWQDGELVAGPGARARRVPLRPPHAERADLDPVGRAHGARTRGRRPRDPCDPRARSRARAACTASTSRSRRAASPKVTEINAGRFFTTSNFFAAAGLNMPDMLDPRARSASGSTRSAARPLPADLYWIRMVDMGLRAGARRRARPLSPARRADVSAALGDAVVSDFDGTLAKLAIPWPALRETLAVDRIEDLWNDADTAPLGRRHPGRGRSGAAPRRRCRP